MSCDKKTAEMDLRSKKTLLRYHYKQQQTMLELAAAIQCGDDVGIIVEQWGKTAKDDGFDSVEDYFISEASKYRNKGVEVAREIALCRICRRPLAIHLAQTEDDYAHEKCLEE